VAVAVRTGTPIFVADELMDTEGIILAAEDDEGDEENEDDDERAVVDPDAVVGEFRHFLDTIRPEDFSS
jgi:bifunctional DNase/RNase